MKYMSCIQGVAILLNLSSEVSFKKIKERLPQEELA